MRLHLLVICALTACALSRVAFAGPHLGKPFPDFDAVDPLTKTKFQLSDYRGKVVLVDFWATWCGPCRAEIPNVKAVYNKYKDKGFEIISISLDQDAGKFRQYVNSNGMKWVHVMDGGGWDTRLAKKYGIRSIPAMFLLDHEGVCISDSARGERLEAAVADAIKKLPAAPATQNEPTSSGKGPATIDRIRADLELLTAQLNSASSAPRGLIQSIQEARKDLESTSGASNDSSAADSSAICDDVKARVAMLRASMFALGLLNGVKVPLPAPGTAAAGSAAADGSQQCIVTARAALDALEKAVAAGAKPLDLLASQISEFRDQLAKEPTTLQQARQKYTTLNANVIKATQKWASGWQAQLNDMDAVLAPLGETDSSIGPRLAAVEKSISELRVRLMSQSRSSRNDLLLRDEYQRIRGELMEICTKVCAAPADCKMPADVYATRSPEDPLVVKEVESQLLVAGQTAKQMKPLVAKASERSKQLRMSFAKRVTALQDEVKKSGNDSGGLEALREKFVALCAEILAAAE